MIRLYHPLFITYRGSKGQPGLCKGNVVMAADGAPATPPTGGLAGCMTLHRPIMTMSWLLTRFFFFLLRQRFSVFLEYFAGSVIVIIVSRT